MKRPTTLDEWKLYVSGLGGTALFSQMTAANSQTFARTLLGEGHSMADVEEVLRLFVRQSVATGTRLPEGGPFDLKAMAADENIESDIDPDLLKAVPVDEDDLDVFLGNAENDPDYIEQ